MVETIEYSFNLDKEGKYMMFELYCNVCGNSWNDENINSICPVCNWRGD
jgi:rubrerythrin